LLRWYKQCTKVERHSSSWWGAGRRWRERGTSALATLTALSLHDHLHWTPLAYLHLCACLDFAKGCVFALAKAVTASVVASPARATAAAAAAGRFKTTHPYVRGCHQLSSVAPGLIRHAARVRRWWPSAARRGHGPSQTCSRIPPYKIVSVDHARLCLFGRDAGGSGSANHSPVFTKWVSSIRFLSVERDAPRAG